MDTLGCSHHATGGSSVPPSPRGAKFTRMTQHQLIILQPCLLLSLLLVWRQWESLPQNLGHFLMTCQGRMSQRCMKRHGGGNALSLELGLGVCSHSSERVSLCHPVSLNTLWVVSCRLKSGKVAYWRHWVNNVQFSHFSMLSTKIRWQQETGPKCRFETESRIWALLTVWRETQPLK